MGRFRPTEWVSPSTLAEAAQVLGTKKARVIAGGTGLFELAERGMLPDSDVLVDIQGLNLEYLRIEGQSLRIGAGSHFSWLLRQEPMNRPDLAGLREAMANVKPVQVRNAATVGGAISISLPFLDFPPAALSFDTEVVLSGMEGKERRVPVQTFWMDYLLPDLRKGELVSEIRIPICQQKSGSAFLKLGRTAGDFALVNVCSRLVFDNDGRCKTASISLGGVANTPVKMTHAEKMLGGRKIDRKTVSKALDTLSEINPTPSIHGSTWYKGEIARVMVRNSILASAKRAGFPVVN